MSGSYQQSSRENSTGLPKASDPQMRSEENVFKKQLLNGTVSQFDIEQRHTNTQPPQRQKVNFLCLSLRLRIPFPDLRSIFHCPRQDVKQSLEGGLPWGRLHCLTPKECYSRRGGEWGQGERKRVQSEMQSMSSKVLTDCFLQPKKLMLAARSLSLATTDPRVGMRGQNERKKQISV